MGEDIRTAVRETYAKIAARDGAGCCDTASDCCAPDTAEDRLGYSAAEKGSVPEGADLGLGCGNPLTIAELQPGETVLDLGSGPGLDCFLAANQVGRTGHVIGVDMTHGMLARARKNAESVDATNVEFRLGEIEHLPVADSTVDVILSNCVINLAPDKRPVFAEAFRVLKPGGRLAIYDIVARGPIPDEARADLDLRASCVSGAIPIGEIEAMLAELGYEAVAVTPVDGSREMIAEWAPGSDVADLVVSAKIQARRPRGDA
ncbi:arsenite methyltransferase [Candidatus Poribacteria bacterium]|jgi:arsenite methyltransferase|nr:arsenite methyltransferase [Candidatus Poribacteria bacterium]MBT5534008.1 arsenite methyltransferase [Candidatus Poribacteria bacterium]MBT5714648.1 arsenite methyltransferase [Candidatus Poribacteria bacterium]MBT7805298.1 arsenite methyltransferase [Candidatus Poribacteria bacterium]